MEPRLRGVDEFADQHFDALFTRLDTVKAAQQPQPDDCDLHQRDAAGAAQPARQDLPDPVLALAQHVLEVGRLWPAAATATTPRTAAASAAAEGTATAALLFPWHLESPLSQIAGTRRIVAPVFAQ